MPNTNCKTISRIILENSDLKLRYYEPNSPLKRQKKVDDIIFISLHSPIELWMNSYYKFCNKRGLLYQRYSGVQELKEGNIGEVRHFEMFIKMVFDIKNSKIISSSYYKFRSLGLGLQSLRFLNLSVSEFAYLNKTIRSVGDLKYIIQNYSVVDFILNSDYIERDLEIFNQNFLAGVLKIQHIDWNFYSTLLLPDYKKLDFSMLEIEAETRDLILDSERLIWPCKPFENERS